jgi:UDP-N-acetyl-D-mannosaminuronate dehydrogenase
LIISSTVFPVISDGNFGAEVTVVATAEVVPLLEATTREVDDGWAAELAAVVAVVAVAAVEAERENIGDAVTVGCG